MIFRLLATCCALTTGAGCNLFRAEGAACRTDANCPGGQICCSGHCGHACNDVGPVVVSMTLVTDYTPSYEFDTVVITLDGNVHTASLAVLTDLLQPRQLAQFPEVQQGAHTMAVVLSLQGTAVASRTISFSATTDVTVPFVITRSCANVVCNGDTNQCLAGQCMGAVCSDLNPSACPPPQCASDSDCVGDGGCAAGVCRSGVCLLDRNDALCTATQRCVPQNGCVPQRHECDIDTQCDDLAVCTLERCSATRCLSRPDDSRCVHQVCNPSATLADLRTGCAPQPCDVNNCVGGPCESASCVSGVCQRTPTCMDGEQCCNGVCGSDCSDPQPCAQRQKGDVCRVVVGSCDIAETCDGTAPGCPADGLVAAATVCRAVNGTCDVAEACTGTSGVCPDDVLLPAFTVCRAAVGTCDVPEACTGESWACPVDVVMEKSTVCRPAAGSCDLVEVCDGVLAACPADVLTAKGTVCRAAVDVCDVAETCSGTAAACPADALSTAVCRASTGGCDPAESCDGKTTTCPADVISPAGTVCRTAPSVCFSNAVCTGTAVCPAMPIHAGTQCASDSCSSTLCDSAGNCTQRQAINEGACCGDCVHCSGGTCVDACTPYGWSCGTSLGVAGNEACNCYY